MSTLATVGDPGRALLQVTALAWVASEVSIRLRTARRARGTRLDRGSVVVVVAGIGAGVLLAIWCAIAVPDAAIPGGWLRAGPGLLLMWLGIALRQWSVFTLGRFFTLVVRVTDDQHVVERGPYRWVRHPSYSGILLTALGLGVALGNWLSILALAVLPTAGLLLRIRVEEAALRSTLGEPYRRYAERRRRLVPGLW